MFPDGPQFGGAPANFACSVAALADEADVYVVSAVGRDELGTRAIELLRSRGVKTDFISVLEQPTGQVLVNLDSSGQATYEFASNTAWDNLHWSDELADLAARADAVCFGTLGQRSDMSRDTINRFVRATPTDCLRILDVNFRPPFWDTDTLIRSLDAANILKLNDAELPILKEVMGWSGSDDALLDHLQKQFALQLVALTRGSDGARLSSATQGNSNVRGEPVAVVNTVGAGDAYTATLTIGLLRDLPLVKVNAWANRVAAFVCTQPGATAEFPTALRQP
jgi:fructokinase